MSDAFNERLRLIRFRRKRETAVSATNFASFPNGSSDLPLALYCGIIIGIAVNHHGFQNGGEFSRDNSFATMSPALSSGSGRHNHGRGQRSLHFVFLTGLRLPRRQAPWHESRIVDSACPAAFWWIFLHWLYHLSAYPRSASLHLPAVRGERQRPLQFLS